MQLRMAHSLKLINCLLFTSGNFHLIFLVYGLPWVTDARESKTVDKGKLLYCHVSLPYKKKKKKVSFSLFIPLPCFKATSSFSQMTKKKKEQDQILQNVLKRS